MRRGGGGLVPRVVQATTSAFLLLAARLAATPVQVADRPTAFSSTTQNLDLIAKAPIDECRSRGSPCRDPRVNGAYVFGLTWPANPPSPEIWCARRRGSTRTVTLHNNARALVTDAALPYLTASGLARELTTSAPFMATFCFRCKAAPSQPPWAPSRRVSYPVGRTRRGSATGGIPPSGRHSGSSPRLRCRAASCLPAWETGGRPACTPSTGRRAS